jgi:hypothetical protein
MPEFKREAGGAIVATIREDDDQIVEVQRLAESDFTLIIHNKNAGGGWDDLTAYLKADDFAELGRIPSAKLPTT